MCKHFFLYLWETEHGQVSWEMRANALVLNFCHIKNGNMFTIIHLDINVVNFSSEKAITIVYFSYNNILVRVEIFNINLQCMFYTTNFAICNKGLKYCLGLGELGPLLKVHLLTISTGNGMCISQHEVEYAALAQGNCYMWWQVKTGP